HVLHAVGGTAGNAGRASGRGVAVRGDALSPGPGPVASTLLPPAGSSRPATSGIDRRPQSSSRGDGQAPAPRPGRTAGNAGGPPGARHRDPDARGAAHHRRGAAGYRGRLAREPWIAYPHAVWSPDTAAAAG